MDCENKSGIDSKNYNSIILPNKSIITEDIIQFENEIPDYIVLYDISGKYVKTIQVKSTIASIQELKKDTYIALCYRDNKIISSIRIIKK